MANIASLLKEEITRLARKELRGETEGLKKSSARHRSEIAALKRRVILLEQQVAKLEKLLARSAPATPPAEASRKSRFSAQGLKIHRARLGLSAQALGSILGVSAQTVYNWEAGTTRPHKDQIARIAVLKGMGKREVQARLNPQG